MGRSFARETLGESQLNCLEVDWLDEPGALRFAGQLTQRVADLAPLPRGSLAGFDDAIEEPVDVLSPFSWLARPC